MRKVTGAPTGPIPPAVLEAPSLSLVVHLYHARRLSLREGSGDFSAATWWREGFSGRRRAVDSPGLQAQQLRLLRLAWRPAPPRLQASPPLMVKSFCGVGRSATSATFADRLDLHSELRQYWRDTAPVAHVGHAAILSAASRFRRAIDRRARRWPAACGARSPRSFISRRSDP